MAQHQVTKKPISLQRQLALWLLLPLALVLGISAYVSYHRALYFANLAYDRSLYRTALALADQVDVDGTNVEADLPQVAKELLEYDESDAVYYRISAPDGRLVAGEKTLPKPQKLPASDEYIFFESEFKTAPIRVVAFSLPIENTDKAVLVEVAETLDKRTSLVKEIVEEMIVPQLLILLLAAGLVFVGIKRGLLPLQQLQDNINARSHLDLSPLNIDSAPREMRPLVSAMNNLMTRVREAVKLQQQFIADASHQMRTPIAGLQTQAELALREKDPDTIHSTLEQVLTSSSRLSHLLSRLLSMASVDPAAGREAKLQIIDLIALSKKITSDFVRAASAKQIDLGLEVNLVHAMILGDELMLQEMLANLIDNAICYTPDGGMITVSIEKNADKIELSVIDNGIGIPPEERTQVFERFHRLRDNEGEGCGLGLAIVKEVVLAHNANIEITDGLKANSHAGFGTKMTVSFTPEYITE